MIEKNPTEVTPKKEKLWIYIIKHQIARKFI